MATLKIGLTGGIASGKSAVCRLFIQLGVPVIDADKIARDLFAPHSPYLQDLKKRFGSSIFNSDASLNRAALRERVFSDSQELAWLNQFTHPKITERIDDQLRTIIFPYVILDIPLLVNTEGNVAEHLKARIDRILVISLDPQTQIERLCLRDKISTEQALKIIGSQSSLQQKLAVSDEVIDNNGSLKQLEQQVSRLHQFYFEHAKQHVN